MLHDIGHGPFSHALETVTGVDHEKWTRAIIMGNTEVNQILENYKKGFANEVAEIINRTHNNKVIVKLLSSQLDADRIDYLLRDSIMTGAGYGSFDLEWLINVLRVGKVNGNLEVGLDLEKGLSIAEDFVMARYYMYKNVYFHKTTRCAECFMKNIFERVFELKEEGREVEIPEELAIVIEATKAEQKDAKEDKILTGKVLDSYLRLTDYKIWYFVDKWMEDKDPVLSSLSKRLLHRDFYKKIPVSEKEFEFIEIYSFIKEEIAEKRNINTKYLLFTDNPSSSAYEDTYISSTSKSSESGGEMEANEQIFLFDKKGNFYELSRESLVINAIRRDKISFYRSFVPKGIKEKIKYKMKL